MKGAAEFFRADSIRDPEQEPLLALHVPFDRFRERRLLNLSKCRSSSGAVNLYPKLTGWAVSKRRHPLII
ncbi:hypothetical protein FACS1894172_03930 [Spirochaetia bacterium]|nr:hypothetical protein FACS1894164_17490 [Spirochaetia bacterium]GHU30510.1 hypothetical protein FACS1894172_03930 [Spirochaetia bacterium]